MKVESCNFLGIQGKSGTLTIKPYTPQYDLVKGAKVPSWVNKLIF